MKISLKKDECDLLIKYLSYAQKYLMMLKEDIALSDCIMYKLGCNVFNREASIYTSFEEDILDE